MNEVSPQSLVDVFSRIVGENLNGKELDENLTLDELFRDNRLGYTAVLARSHLALSEACDVPFEDNEILSSKTVKDIRNWIFATAREEPKRAAQGTAGSLVNLLCHSRISSTSRAGHSI